MYSLKFVDLSSKEMMTTLESVGISVENLSELETRKGLETTLQTNRTSFQRCNNVVDVYTTLYQRQNSSKKDFSGTPVEMDDLKFWAEL